MRFEISIEPPNRFRGAHSADEIFRFQKFERPVDGCLRQGRHPLAQPGVESLGGRVAGIFRQGAVHGQPLRCNSHAARAACVLEGNAPAIYLSLAINRFLLAINCHVRIIII